MTSPHTRILHVSLYDMMTESDAKVLQFSSVAREDLVELQALLLETRPVPCREVLRDAWHDERHPRAHARPRAH